MNDGGCTGSQLTTKATCRLRGDGKFKFSKNEAHKYIGYEYDELVCAMDLRTHTSHSTALLYFGIIETLVVTRWSISSVRAAVIAQAPHSRVAGKADGSLEHAVGKKPLLEAPALFAI